MKLKKKKYNFADGISKGVNLTVIVVEGAVENADAVGDAQSIVNLKMIVMMDNAV